jgi:hypothetical protein
MPSEVRILPSPPVFFFGCVGGNSSVGRARAFQARGRGFESRFPLQENRLEPGRLKGPRRVYAGCNWAHVAQSVEHFLGKEEVTGSNPVVGLQNLTIVAARAPDWSSGPQIRGSIGKEAMRERCEI